jgi:glycerol-3-phosphate dehydrogenase
MSASSASYDLLVVGGGINGAGIARDAAGRGLKVLLVEQGDLAGATSSASSKLIHGGLRYLEHYEFRLVREALAEREVLLKLAPHIIWPLEFVLPHDASMRPAWMIRAGLFLYDHLAKRATLPGSRRVDLTKAPFKSTLTAGNTTGFAYADCWVEDSRLVVLNAIDARERGADIRTRTRFVNARRQDGVWHAEIEHGGQRATVIVGAIVNAAGPWVQSTLAATGANSPGKVRLVKGSHIIVPRLHAGEQAFILQNTDNRVVFVVPYEANYSLIGTTDVDFKGDPGQVAISPEEIDYLCKAAGRFFQKAPAPTDVAWSFAGVRPLYDDAESNASEITRDYVLALDAPAGTAPLLSIFGGKITTYRRLAEEALAKLTPAMKARGITLTDQSWTATAPLPGGDLPCADFSAFLARVRAARPWLPADLATRLAHAYGTRIDRVLGNAKSVTDLGRALGAGLTEREAEYLVGYEWAQTADDILWRRSKLGLHGGKALADTTEAWLTARSS